MTSSQSLDTDPEIKRRQVEMWRAMSFEDRYASFVELQAAVEQLARAGIAMTRPDLDERGTLKELARRRYGSELAEAAYPARS